MKNILFFPPNWGYSHPYLSVPCLLSNLQDNGIEIEGIDLNILSLDFFMSNEFLDICLEKIKEKTNNINTINKYILVHKFINENKNKFNYTFKDKKYFLNLAKYIKAKIFLDELYNFINVAFPRFKMSRSGLYIDELKKLEDINCILENNEENPYWHFFKHYMYNVNAQELNIVCISLAATAQLFPALTLCKLLKYENPNIKIVLEGNPLTKIKDRINEKWIFLFEEFFDFILFYEGELSLLKLMKMIQNKGDINLVSNCMYYRENEIRYTKSTDTYVDINKISTPRFNKQELQKYHSSEVILPYYVTRGCYWKKCAFCDHDFGYDDHYRIKCIDKVISDIKFYKKEYQVEAIHFVDEALPPSFIKALCTDLIKNNIQIKWFTCIKASKMYNDELCSLMREAGCVFVSIGVESCCQAILNTMNKGIDLDDIHETLSNMKKNNIWAHVFLINDFEGESAENRLETLSYIITNKSIFPSAGLSSFSLSKNAKIYKEINLKENIEYISDFTNDLVYQQKKHSSDKELESLRYIYNNLNYTNIFFSRYLIEREHIFMFMKHVPQLLNNDFLNQYINNSVKFNFEFVIYEYTEDGILLYNLLTKQTFKVSEKFTDILEILKTEKEINKIIEIIASIYKEDSSSIIEFIVNELYRYNND